MISESFQSSTIKTAWSTTRSTHIPLSSTCTVKQAPVWISPRKPDFSCIFTWNHTLHDSRINELCQLSWLLCYHYTSTLYVRMNIVVRLFINNPILFLWCLYIRQQFLSKLKRRLPVLSLFWCPRKLFSSPNFIFNEIYTVATQTQCQSHFTIQLSQTLKHWQRASKLQN